MGQPWPGEEKNAVGNSPGQTQIHLPQCNPQQAANPPLRGEFFLQIHKLGAGKSTAILQLVPQQNRSEFCSMCKLLTSMQTSSDAVTPRKQGKCECPFMAYMKLNPFVLAEM